MKTMTWLLMTAWVWGIACGTSKSNLSGTVVLISMQTTADNTLPVLRCSPVTLILAYEKDTGTMVAAAKDIPIKLAVSSTPANIVEIFSDKTCSAKAATGTIAKGFSSTTLYIKSSRGGSAALSASAEGYQAQGTIGLKFQEGKITLTQDRGMVSSLGTLGNTCQGIHIQTTSAVPEGTVLTLKLKDPAGSAFYRNYSNLSCDGPSTTPNTTQVTLSPNVGSQTVYVKVAPSATSVEISAEAPGVEQVQPLTIAVKPITLLLAVGEVMAGGDTSAVSANRCTSLKICTAQPATDQCVSAGDVRVDLTVTGGAGAAIYSDSQCVKQITSLSYNGSIMTFAPAYVKGQTAGQSAKITGTMPGLSPVSYDINFK